MFCDSFKLIRLSRKRFKDKRWITPRLKISSRHKNRLFRRWLNSGSLINEKKYKNYRRLYKQIADKTQKHLVLIKHVTVFLVPQWKTNLKLMVLFFNRSIIVNISWCADRF